MTKRNLIRDLNDRFRQFMDVQLGTVRFSEGFISLTTAEMSSAIAAVQNFAAFDEGNDPFGEHDFGTVKVGVRTIVWNIEYYADHTRQAQSQDPSDYRHCFRVLRIMLIEEV